MFNRTPYEQANLCNGFTSEWDVMTATPHFFQLLLTEPAVLAGLASNHVQTGQPLPRIQAEKTAMGMNFDNVKAMNENY